VAVAGYLPPIVAEVLAEVGKFKAEMGEVKEEMSTLQATQTKLAAAGKVAMAGLAIAVAGVGYESVKLASNFDQTMELIRTQAGDTTDNLDGLKNAVLNIAPAVGIGPEKLAEGLYHIISTGMRGQAALDTLTQAAKLASIGMADLDDVTYAMSGVMSIGMKDVHSAADAISFMNATVGMGDMRMDKLTQAIGTGILPAFKSAGLGMTDFAASLATLTDNSVPADEAATRLKMTVALMSAPTMRAADALESIGLSSTQLAEDMRQPNGMLVAVMDLKKHLEAAGLTAVQQNQVIEHAFGGGRTSGAIMTLIQESDRLKSKYDQLGTAAGRAAATNDAWAEQQKQFSQQVHELEAKLQVLGIRIGNWLIPKLMSFAHWLSEHKKLIKELAPYIGAVLVVAIAAYTASMIAAAAATIAAQASTLLIGAGIALVIYAIYELVKHWTTVWNWINKIAGDVWHWIYNNIWVPIRDWFKDFSTGLGVLKDDWYAGWHAIGDAIKDVYDHTIGPIIDKVQSGVSDLKETLKDLTGLGPGGGKLLPNANTGAAKGGGDKLLQNANKLPSYDVGGTVPGPAGRPQLAIVHGGERILTVDQVAALGRRPGTTPAGPAATVAAQGGDLVINQTIVTPDGEVLRRQQLRYARRAGLNPNELFPASTGSLVRG